MKLFKNLRNRLRKNMLSNERGQGATEYILLLVVVIGLMVAFKGKITGAFEGATTKVGEKMNQVVDD